MAVVKAKRHEIPYLDDAFYLENALSAGKSGGGAGGFSGFAGGVFLAGAELPSAGFGTCDGGLVCDLGDLRIAELLTVSCLVAGASTIVADLGRPGVGLSNLPRLANPSSPFFGSTVTGARMPPGSPHR